MLITIECGWVSHDPLCSTGPCSFGLAVTCKGTNGGDHMECHRQNNLSPYWTTTLVLIILGMVGILIVFSVLIMALWKNRTEVGSVTKWISFFSSKRSKNSCIDNLWFYSIFILFCCSCIPHRICRWRNWREPLLSAGATTHRLRLHLLHPLHFILSAWTLVHQQDLFPFSITYL